MTSKTELPTNLHEPFRIVLEGMKELSEIRTLQELVDKNLKAVDKHFEEVARPKIVR